MTRVNIGYPVQKLTRQHLLSEHREIKRIPNMVLSGRAKIENATDSFTLGKGHVTFFYKRLGYLLRRYKEIYNECIIRGYNVKNYVNAWNEIPEHLMGEYIPTKRDKALIEKRINKRNRILKFK